MVKLLQRNKLIILSVIFIFLISNFSILAQGNKNVSILNGFDSRLITGFKIGVPDLNTKIDISIALKINNEQQLDTFLSQV